MRISPYPVSRFGNGKTDVQDPPKGKPLFSDPGFQSATAVNEALVVQQDTPPPQETQPAPLVEPATGEAVKTITISTGRRKKSSLLTFAGLALLLLSYASVNVYRYKTINAETSKQGISQRIETLSNTAPSDQNRLSGLFDYDFGTNTIRWNLKALIQGLEAPYVKERYEHYIAAEVLLKDKGVSPEIRNALAKVLVNHPDHGIFRGQGNYEAMAELGDSRYPSQMFDAFPEYKAAVTNLQTVLKQVGNGPRWSVE